MMKFQPILDDTLLASRLVYIQKYEQKWDGGGDDHNDDEASESKPWGDRRADDSGQTVDERLAPFKKSPFILLNLFVCMVRELLVEDGVGNSIADSGEDLRDKKHPNVADQKVRADTREPDDPAQDHKEEPLPSSPGEAVDEHSKDSFSDEEDTHGKPGIKDISTHLLDEYRIYRQENTLRKRGYIERIYQEQIEGVWLIFSESHKESILYTQKKFDLILFLFRQELSVRLRYTFLIRVKLIKTHYARDREYHK